MTADFGTERQPGTALTSLGNVNFKAALQRPGGPRSDLLVDAPTPDTHGEDNHPAKLPCAAGFYDQTNYLQLLKPRLNGWGFC